MNLRGGLEMKKIIDFSQSYREKMPHVPAFAGPRIKTILAAEKDIANVMEFTFTTHTGTHLDAPLHLFKKGKTIDEIKIDRLIGAGVILDLSRKKKCEPITANDLKQAKPIVQRGDIVLVYTGWGKKIFSEEYHDHPYFSEDAAEWLIKKRVNILGTDTLTPDKPYCLRETGFNMPIHRMLLSKEILIIENLMNLEKAKGKRLEVMVIPIKIEKGDGAPARVFGRV
jgi:arylformamidase